MIKRLQTYKCFEVKSKPIPSRANVHSIYTKGDWKGEYPFIFTRSFLGASNWFDLAPSSKHL